MVVISKHTITSQMSPELAAAVLERVTKPERIPFNGKQKFCGEVSDRSFRFYLKDLSNDAIYAKGCIGESGTGSAVHVSITLSPRFFMMLAMMVAVYIFGFIGMRGTELAAWAACFPFFFFAMFFLMKKEEKDTVRKIADMVDGKIT